LNYSYLLALGSNLGDRQANIREALVRLQDTGEVLRCSSVVETAPLPSAEFDVSEHAPYLNCVCEFVSPLSPGELYDRVRTIEDAMGHQRHRRWLPREMDIDLLFCGRSDLPVGIVDAQPVFYRGVDGFIIPHARFWERDFLIEIVTVELGIDSEFLARHSMRRMVGLTPDVPVGGNG
jgi:2-amino-4-hydroxy-6-hydroxymethyldihydropteridine diphosphokinase